MSSIDSAAIAQQEALSSLSRRVELSVGRTVSASVSSLSLSAAKEIPSDNAQKLLDVVEISDDAKAEILRNRNDAEVLAEYVRRGRGIEIRVLPPSPKKVEIKVSEQTAKESFSFTESLKVKLSQSVSVQSDSDGGVSVERNSSVEVERSVSFTSSSQSGSTSITV